MADMGKWVIPDALEPLYGVRIWQTGVGESWGEFSVTESIYLQSYAQSTRYPPGELTFECYTGHKQPTKDCVCGIWGCWTPDDIRYAISVDPFSPAYVLGRIKGWGSCVVADRGFRAEHVEILAFIDNGHPDLPLLSEVYQVPIEEDDTRKVHVVRVSIKDVRDAKTYYIRDSRGNFQKWGLLEERVMETQKKLQEEGWYVHSMDHELHRDEYTVTLHCSKDKPYMLDDF